MAKYISYFKEMEHEQKELIFLGYLKSQLLLNNFFVATPEPDIGEDIWVANNNIENYQIHPAQIKSAFTFQWVHKGERKRYVVNIKARRFESTLQRKFYYFFGLYDPEHIPGSFHVACIPSSFFLEHWDFLTKLSELRKKNHQGSDKQQINLYFDYSSKENKYYAFSKPLEDVTRFFRDFNEIT